jgi:membrane fusion protein (multidrug efflux system)
LLIGLDATLKRGRGGAGPGRVRPGAFNLKRSEDQPAASSSAQCAETATSNAQVAEAKLKLAQARLSKMRIIAPFDGSVGIRNVSLGDYVKDGTDLVNVEDVRILKVDFRLPERNYSQVRVGQTIEVVADALPNERWQGRIDDQPEVDADGRSLDPRAPRTPAASCDLACSCACA